MGRGWELLETYHRYVGDDYMPPDMLPIATGGGPNLVCLALSGEHKGSVFYWDHDAAPIPYDYSCLYLISSSFDEFLKLIYLRDDLT